MAENGKSQITVGVDDAKLKPLLTQLKLLEVSFKQNAVTAEQFNRVAKDLEKQVNNLSLSSTKYAQAQSALTQSSIRVQNQFTSMSGSFKALQEEQHKATQASNRSQQAFVSLAYIIQDLPYGIRGVANNITQLSQVLGTPIWLNLAISAFTSLAVVFDSNKNKVKELSNELKSFEDRHSDFLLKMGINTRAMRESDLEWQVAQAEGNLQRLATGKFDFRATVGARAAGKGAKAVYTAVGTPEEIRAAQTELENLLLTLKQFRDETAKLNEKAEKKSASLSYANRPAKMDFTYATSKGTITKLSDINDLDKLYKVKMSDPFALIGMPNGQVKFAKDVTFFEFDMSKPLKGVRGVGKADGIDGSNYQKDALKELTVAYNSLFFDPVRAGFRALSDEIMNGLFGSLESLRQKFGNVGAAIIQSLNQVIAKLLETAMITSLLQILFPGSVSLAGGFGSVFGSLLTGGKYTDVTTSGGGRTIGSISPKTVNQIATGSSMANTMRVVGETRISGNDILVVYRNANATDIRRNA